MPTSKLLRSLCRLRILGQFSNSTCEFHKVHNVKSFSFCTKPESLESNELLNPAESPELPEWVKSPGEKERNVSETVEDEDFVLPSMSNWIESHAIHRDEKIDVKCTVGNNVASDLEKVSRVLKTTSKRTEDIPKLLDACDVDVTESLVEQVLRRFSFDWVPAFGFFKWAKRQRGFKLSPQLHDLMVDNLGKTRKFDFMWEMVEDMHQLEGHITLATMCKVMRRLAGAGRYEDAVGAFRRLEHFGVNVDIRALNVLLDALVKEGNVELAENIYSEYKVVIPPNAHTFNVLVHGYCKTRQMTKAKKTIEEMRARDICPDVVTYTCFVEAYAREKDFRKVDATLEKMRRNGCQPTVVTYTIVMKALAKAKEIDRALDVYAKMRQNNCVPDSSFCGALIQLLSKAGRLKDAHEIFDSMIEQGIAPDATAYNTMIAMESQHYQEENALRLLQKMEDTHCKPDLKTYVPLLKMCCKLKRMKVLSFLLNHMFKNDVGIDLGTYALLVRGLSRSGKHERACSFFEESVMRGFVPMDFMFEKLVQELEQNGLDKQKERVEELMLQAKQQNSDYCFKKSVKDKK